jgi:hypothetical protein
MAFADNARKNLRLLLFVIRRSRQRESLDTRMDARLSLSTGDR